MDQNKLLKGDKREATLLKGAIERATIFCEYSFRSEREGGGSKSEGSKNWRTFLKKVSFFS